MNSDAMCGADEVINAGNIHKSLNTLWIGVCPVGKTTVFTARHIAGTVRIRRV